MGPMRRENAMSLSQWFLSEYVFFSNLSFTLLGVEFNLKLIISTTNSFFQFLLLACFVSEESDYGLNCRLKFRFKILKMR